MKLKRKIRDLETKIQSLAKQRYQHKQGNILLWEYNNRQHCELRKLYWKNIMLELTVSLSNNLSK